MSLIWGVWLGMGASGGEVESPLPRVSASFGADLYGGLMFNRFLTFQLSLYPNLQTGGTCVNNWIRAKTSVLLGNHEIGAMASPLCILYEGEYDLSKGDYTETYKYITGAWTYGVGGYYNVRLTFIRTVRAYVGFDVLYPIMKETVPLKNGYSRAPHVSYMTFGFHVGWMWGRKFYF